MKETSTAQDARIDAALRDRFRVPSGNRLDEILERALEEDRALDRRRSVWPAALILAVAAGIVLIVNLGADNDAPTAVDEPQRVEFIASAADWDLNACVGPLATVDPDQDSVRVRRPNLESIYAQAQLWTSDRNWNVCGSSDNLTDSLLASYGQELELKTEAANMLQGPFASQQWPTGTILTGFPDDETAVLIAESDSTHACCLEVALSDASDLRMFTRIVGDIVLTEITPLDEPRLLDYFAEVH